MAIYPPYYGKCQSVELRSHEYLMGLVNESVLSNFTRPTGYHPRFEKQYLSHIVRITSSHTTIEGYRISHAYLLDQQVFVAKAINCLLLMWCWNAGENQYQYNVRSLLSPNI